MSIEMTTPRDHTKIDVNNLGELIWWSNHLGICPENLLSIIGKAGNSLKQVREYMRQSNGVA